MENNVYTVLPTNIFLLFPWSEKRDLYFGISDFLSLSFYLTQTLFILLPKKFICLREQKRSFPSISFFWCQFHQRFTRAFFVRKFIQSQTLSRVKTFMQKMPAQNVDEIDNRWFFVLLLTNTRQLMIEIRVRPVDPKMLTETKTFFFILSHPKIWPF